MGVPITIQDNMLIAWNLLGWSGGPVTGGVPIATILSYGTTTWDGDFAIYGFAPPPGPFSPTGFAGPYFYGSNPGNPGYYDGYLELIEGDGPNVPNAPGASGIWRPLAPSVPDSGTTIQLLGVALAGMGACRRWIRTRI